MNGAIWQPCDEPTLKVSRGNDAWGMHLGLHEFYSRDWHTYYLAVDEFDLAYEWIGTLDNEVKQRPRLEPKIVIDPRYQTVTRGAVEDVRQLCRHVMQKVGRATDNLAEQRPDVIMAYSDLKRFLEIQSEHLDDADVDAAVATFDRLCTADENQKMAYEAPNPLRVSNAPLRQMRTAVDLHIRRWQDRPINIVTNRVMPRLG